MGNLTAHRTDRPAFHLRVSIAQQRLELIENGEVVQRYPVSTAQNGPGERKGSGCTPRGWHVIRARIGKDAPANAVFVGRRWTGEIYDADLAERHPDRDWILSRILWLGGLEPGFNRYGEVDTAWRYIYIHGSPDQGVTGRPQSHGCIRMRSFDLLDLFDRVEAGTWVSIEA
ncbi:MAG: L,D-transpeptidase [Methylococcaceae bacterium]|nr:L,D-transpeptidase [Methylococcaceae bacterium]